MNEFSFSKFDFVYNDHKIEFWIYSHNEEISNYIRNGIFYESEVLEYISKNYKKHGIILDIGANIGNHTKYFAEFLDYECIYSFEPNKNNFELLKRNTEFYDNINLMNVALLDENGYCGLTEYLPNMGSLTLVGGNDVIVRELDEYSIKNITLIKIDVEFSEIRVLMGSLRTLSESKPVIFIECGTIDNLKPVTDILKRFGYKIKNVHTNRIIEYSTS